MDTQELKRIVEALIFAADEPLGGDRIAETVELENGFDLGVLIDALNQDYQQSGRAFTIRKVAGGYQIVTQKNYSSWIRKLYLGRQKNRLSHAALETLALIAFKQPISRVDIAQIRGVNSDGVIGTLLERKLIAISGRSEAVGRPLLYSTTPEFLKYFGINDIADLPKPREIEELFSKEGMPEELLQALSQTDAQLSLPIGETPAVSDDAESKDIKPEEPAPPTPPLVETPLEISDVQIPETISNSEAVNIVPDNQAVATVASSPEHSSIDINEQVVTLIEDAGKPETSSPTAANESASEIAWISLNGDTNNQAEHFTGTELAVEDLTEIPSALQNIAEPTKVVTAHLEAAASSTAETADVPETRDSMTATKTASLEMMLEDISSEFARTDAVIDTGEETTNAAMVADVDEIVETAMRSASEGIQIVELAEAGLSDFKPPELKSDAADEIDGWVAEEFSNDEIAEPDFVQKAENFFLEEVPEPKLDSAAVNELDENVIADDPEPIVVSTPALSGITDEIFQQLDESPEAQDLPNPEPLFEASLPSLTDSPDASQADARVVDESPELLPERSENVTIVNLDESAFVETLAETTLATFDAARPVQVVTESLKSADTASPSAKTILEAEAHVPAWPATPRVDTPAPKEVLIDQAQELPTIAIDGMSPATLRERVLGWIKRTFGKFMSLIGAKV
jgi:segregation and condensation protein B